MKNKIYLEDIKEDNVRNFTECVLKSYKAIRKNDLDFAFRMDHADRYFIYDPRRKENI